MTSDLVPKLRKEYPPMPAEHMRLIGEICVYWAAMEKVILQAVGESMKIDGKAGLYLGMNIPTGTRMDMLHAIANVLKESPEQKEVGTELLRLLQPVRNAYLLRNKYAHAQLATNGPDKEPEIRVIRLTKRVEIQNRPLPLSEIKADADTIFDACEALINFLQARGLCKQAWT